jgi:threonine/homoserine/homoserine lactone efflux protein
VPACDRPTKKMGETMMTVYPAGAPLYLFFLLVLGIVALPGMDMAYVMAHALAGGRRLGYAAVGGIVLGGAAHVAFAVFGIGLVVRDYPAVFQVLLFAGCAYLAWIGFALARGASALADPKRALHAHRASTVFGRGTLTCLLNPKAYLFTLAVFPQFLQPGAGSTWHQALLMGAIVTLTQAGVYGSVALGASSARTWLLHNPALQVQAARLVGLLLIAAAAWSAWHGAMQTLARTLAAVTIDAHLEWGVTIAYCSPWLARYSS